VSTFALAHVQLAEKALVRHSPNRAAPPDGTSDLEYLPADRKRPLRRGLGRVGHEGFNLVLAVAYCEPQARTMSKSMIVTWADTPAEHDYPAAAS
jgi:hypothetical protein